MQKILIFLTTICILLNFTACESQLPNANEEEFIELGLIPKGIDMTLSPMSTKATSSDLYMVSVYKDKAIDGNEYAAWLTDDLQSEKIKLLKGRKYVCCVYYFPDGKNILADYESGSVYPICGFHLQTPRLSDGILYGAQYGYGNPISGAAKKKGDKNSGYQGSGYDLNDVVRYYGRVTINASEDITADIDLYMQMVGLNITALNLNKGVIMAYSPTNAQVGCPENNAIYLTPESPSVDKVIAPNWQPWYQWGDDKDYINYESTINLLIDYIDENNKGINILKLSDYPIKRMTKLNITLDLDDILNDISAGITPNVVNDEEWTDVIYN